MPGQWVDHRPQMKNNPHNLSPSSRAETVVETPEEIVYLGGGDPTVSTLGNELVYGEGATGGSYP